MEKKEEVFIFISQEIQELLADNELSISDIISESRQDFEMSFSQNPAEQELSGYKEPTSVIILASAALIVALTPIIKTTLSTLSHKSVIAEELILVPVEDSKGDVVRDNNGQPILHWVEKIKIIESQETDLDGLGFAIEGHGINISYSDRKGEN